MRSVQGDRSSILKVCLLMSSVKFLSARKVSRVENITLTGWKNFNEELSENSQNQIALNIFNGSLIQEIKNLLKNSSRLLILDFRLAQRGETPIKNSFRIRVGVEIQPEKLAKGPNLRTYNQNSKQRITVTVYRKSEFQWGVEPRDPLPNTNLKSLDLELDHNGSLNHLSLQLTYSTKTQKKKATTSTIGLKFSRQENTHYSYQGVFAFYTSYLRWLPPVSFIYISVFLFFCIISTIIQSFASRAPISLYFQNDQMKRIFLYKNFIIFYKIRYFTLVSIRFLYSSYPSFILLAILLAAEFLADLYIRPLPLALFEECDQSGRSVFMSFDNSLPRISRKNFYF